MRSTWLFVLLAACSGDDGGEPAIFPADYAETYTEVRNCRNSIDHDLMRIRVVASPDALQPYTDRNAPFPVGAILLKEQYEDFDTTCSGPITEITVMVKTDTPDQLGWAWQKTDGAHKPIEHDLKKCTSCHTGCGVPEEGGYDGTCTHP